MARPFNILSALLRASANADDDVQRAQAGEEIRAYLAEPEALAALVAIVRCDAEHLADWIAVAPDAELGERLAKRLKKDKATNASVQADVDELEAQERADDVSRSVVRTGTNEYTLDARALLAAASVGKASRRLGFVVDGAGNLEVDVPRLRAIAREAKAQKWNVTARLVFAPMPTTRVVTKRNVKRTVTAVETQWLLVVEYVRPSGTRGSLRFKHNLAPKAGMVLSVVHVGIEANDTKAA